MNMSRLLKTCRTLLVFLVASLILVACGGTGSGGKTGTVSIVDGNTGGAVTGGTETPGGTTGGTTSSGTSSIGSINNGPVLALTNDTQFMYVQRTVSADAQARKDKFNQLLASGTGTPADLTTPYEFRPGAKLINRSSLDVNAVDTEVLTAYFNSSDYDVKDLNVSPDGQFVIFAAHGPLTNAHDYTWSIYEYSFKTKAIRRIIKDDAVANAGQDTNPTYAFDGSIVFSSDRSAGNPNSPIDDIVDGDQIGKCIKVGPSEKPSLLHSMSNQGEHILQLTYGKNYDTKPTTLKDGRIAFVRWSRSYELLTNCPAVNALKTYDDIFSPIASRNLDATASWSNEKKCALAKTTADGKVLTRNHYTVLRITADGKELQQLYKTVTASGADDSFVAPDHLIQAEDGRLMTILSQQYNTFMGGNLLALQAPDSTPVDKIFGNFNPVSLISGEIDLYPNQRSINGWLSAVWPYRDGTGRKLVSLSQCAAVKNGVSSFCKAGSTDGTVSSQYGIWVLDEKTNTRLPIIRARADVVYSDLALAQPMHGADYPYAPVNEKFVDDLDESRLVCVNPPLSSSSSSYYSSSSSSYVSSESSSYESSSSYTSSSSSSVIIVIPSSSSVASSTTSSWVASSSASSWVASSSSSEASSWVPSSSSSSVTSVVASSSLASVVTSSSSSLAISSVSSSKVASSVVSSLASSKSSSSASSAPRNTKPVANAGADKFGDLGNTLVLDGSASTDVDGDVLTYKWRVVSGPVGSAAQVVNYTTVKPTITLDKYGIYTIELVVNDGIVDSDPDTVVINTNNARPIANAGPDQSVTVGELALLNGTGSSDPEAQKLTYTWTIVSKPAGSTTTLVNPNEDMPQIKIDKAGSYVVQLVVNDGIENSEPDTVVLNTKNLKPIAVAGKTQTVYVGDKVSLNGSGSSDPEGDKLTYRWSFTNKPVTTNARLSSTTAVAPTFDADVEGTFVVQLIVNDGALDSNPDTVTINVEQVQCDTSNDTKRTIPVTIRDFDKSHPDFEKFDGVELGIVKENLGSDGLPVYAKQSGGTKTTSGKANFDQWYRDVAGININIPKTIQMSRDAGKTIWSYTNDNFFPIDGLGFGNMPKPYPDHNFHFTLETHMEFDYTGGEVFTFKGDDDLWVFINGKLAIDIGGVHGVETRSINLNDRAAYLGIQKGKKYKFDLFFAERHTYKSNFMFQTNINLECTPRK